MTPNRPLVPASLARGRHGGVVAPHHLATATGLDILRSGGTAVDAAIATNAALAVVMPQACGLGGDAFWLIWDAGSRTETALNGSGRAPADANPVRLRRAGLDRLPFRGPMSVTIPGAVRSWGDAHRRHGRLGRDRILASAIELARDGFPADEAFIGSVERTATALGGALPDEGRAWASQFRPHGRPWRPGEIVRRPALGATLERLADAGFDDFYEGELAAKLARGLKGAGSLITAGDLADHLCTLADPIATTYRGVEVTTHPPNSSGIVALELLNVLECFEPPPASAFGPEGVADPGWVHLGIEAAKLAFADRDAAVTDPVFHDVPVEHLLDRTYAAELAGRIHPSLAALPPASTAPRGGGTIYLASVDAEGNAVSLIQSNYMGFGSGVVDAETGVHFQNRGSYFSLEPDHPNLLAPGKRTLHTLLPGMLFRDGEPWVVVGSMGGDAQPQIFAQVVSALVDGALDVASAIASPRWFVEPADHFAPPVEVTIEPRFAPETLAALESFGHPLHPAAPFDSAVGHCHAIELAAGGPGADEGGVAAATDPRSAGLPAVW
ncbi:MAG: gamma-glutamyltransferase family protein [Chloroflexi bacterium]|nr:MAG: gamma-glutamyltransferase family protein [Chloroflexota bacterium]